jgi:HicB family
MDLSEYAESLRRELTSITKFAGEDIARAAEMISETLDSSVRLALLDVLSAAAEEITASLDGATIDVRLTGTQPEFVVNVPHDSADPGYETGGEGTDEAGSARVTLRLSESLKARVETAAVNAGVSVNAWLVRAISRSLEAPSGPARPRPPFPPPPGRKGLGKRYTGFARS